MERLGISMSILNHMLDTKRNRHILGGALISLSLLFGGLAITVITLKTEDEDENELQLY